MPEGARVGVRYRDLAEPFEGPGHIGATVAEQDTLPMLGIRADADVSRDAKLGNSLLHRTDGAHDDVVALARDERPGVLAI